MTHHDCSDDPTQFPRMFWPTNMSRLACMTMFTVFFGGERFAPDLQVEGESMQHYLQRHYVDALSLLAAALKNERNVIGFGSMNEPLPGLIGCSSLNSLSSGLHKLKNGPMPTPLQAMALGAGLSVKVKVSAVTRLILCGNQPARR